MNKYLVFLTVLLCMQGLEAKNLTWIKPTRMSFQEFNVYIQTLSSGKSFAQSLLDQRRQKSKSLNLKAKLLVAQELYLLGEGIKAIKAFKQISELSYQADWNEEDRRIILYAFLRQAQSEEDIEKRKALLISASQFGFFQINSSNYLDYQLFPPPLMDQLNLIQTKAHFLTVDWKNIFPHHEIVLLNGKQLKHSKIPQGFYRITALSSSHEAWSKNISLSQLFSQEIQTQSLSQGFCENLKIKPKWKNSKFKIVSFKKCPKLIGLQLQEKNKSKQSKNILKSKSISHFTEEPEFEKLSDSSMISKSQELESFRKSKLEKNTFSSLPSWLIFGAGVITLTLVLSLSQKKTNKKQKKEKYVY